MSYESKIKNAAWETLGNTGLSAATHFLGTTDNVDLIVKTNSVEALRVLAANQNVGVGTQTPTAKVNIVGPNANAGANPLFRIEDTTIPATGLAVDNGVGANAYRLITTGTPLQLQAGPNSNQVVVALNGGVGFGNGTPAAKVDVSGAAVLRPALVSDIATDGPIGTAAGTVDGASTVHINQTTAGVTATIPSPANTQAGRLLTVINTGTADVTVGGEIVKAGKGQAFEWDGTAWIPVGSTPPTVPVYDFWRSGAHLANVMPDGATDTTDQIEHVGGVTVGSGASPAPEGGQSIGTGIFNAASPTQMATNAAAAPETALRLFRAGTSAVKFNASVDLKVGSYAASGVAARSNATLSLGNGNVHTPDTDVMTWQANGFVGINTTAPVAAFDLVGAEVIRPAVVANIVASGPMAASFVDGNSIVQITQGTPGVSVALPAPTNPQAGRLLTIVNNGTASLTVGGQAIAPSTGQAFEWDGLTWQPIGSPPPTAVDFWRSGDGTILPDNANDTTDSIAHNGKVLVGAGDPTGVLAALEISGGRGNTGAAGAGVVASDVAFVYSNNAGYRHWLTTEHDAAVAGRNRLNLWINNGVTAAASSAPGTGNQNPFSVTANGLILTNGAVDARSLQAAAPLDVAGAEVLRPVLVANIAANGPIGTAAATVDVASTIQLTQTAAGISVTLPAPTNAQAGRRLIVVNTGTADTTIGGQIVAFGKGQLFEWDGAAWRPIGSAAGMKKYSALHTFAAGVGLVIPHALGLAAGDFEGIVIQARDTLGNNVDLRASAFTTNSVTLLSNVAQTNVRIVIIG